jgi:hypothetical protein
VGICRALCPVPDGVKAGADCQLLRRNHIARCATAVEVGDNVILGIR